MRTPSEALMETLDGRLFKEYRDLMAPYSDGLFRVADAPNAYTPYDVSQVPFRSSANQTKDQATLDLYASILVPGYQSEVVEPLVKPSYRQKVADIQAEGRHIFYVTPHGSFIDPAVPAAGERFAAKRLDIPFDGEEQLMIINKAVSALDVGEETVLDLVSKFCEVLLSFPASQSIFSNDLISLVRQPYSSALVELIEAKLAERARKVFISPSGETDKLYRIGRRKVLVMHSISDGTVGLLIRPDVVVQPVYVNTSANPVIFTMLPIMEEVREKDDVVDIMKSLAAVHTLKTGQPAEYMDDYGFLKRAVRIATNLAAKQE